MRRNILSVFGITLFFVVLNLLWIFPENSMAMLTQADKVVVIKSERLLVLLRNGEIIKSYKVALGKRPEGPKERAGDSRTPEGLYSLDRRNVNSRFHRALHISYPNADDIRHAKEHGVSPGRDIMIHGLPKSFEDVGEWHRIVDWTKGCIAVTNSEIDEILKLVPDGTPIEIKP